MSIILSGLRQLSWPVFRTPKIIIDYLRKMVNIRLKYETDLADSFFFTLNFKKILIG